MTYYGCYQRLPSLGQLDFSPLLKRQFSPALVTYEPWLWPDYLGDDRYGPMDNSDVWVT